MNPLRLRAANEAGIRHDGDHVLYWMIAARRTRSSVALDHAIARARELKRPLVVLEALRCDHPWAALRHHAFAVEGMDDQAARFARSPVAYLAYVEPHVGAGKGLLAALASRASLVVTDESPASFRPRMVEAAAAKLPVRLEVVDGYGVVPLRAVDHEVKRAFDFRRIAARWIAEDEPPIRDPLAGLDLPVAAIPADLRTRWPTATDLDALPIDQRIGRVPFTGGARSAHAALDHFVSDRLARYASERAHPDLDATSGLSPWLHWGHLGVHEILDAVGAAAKMVDEVVVWRELAAHTSFVRREQAERYEGAPAWARATLETHASDPRQVTYELPQLAAAATDDVLWNACQRQLLGEGRIHNALRMLWGKRVLTWTRTPREAWDVLVELNNRYAIDGRDPNSYAGIGWVFGRYDRPFPERAIFGTVRPMTSNSTGKRLKLKEYLRRWS